MNQFSGERYESGNCLITYVELEVLFTLPIICHNKQAPIHDLRIILRLYCYELEGELAMGGVVSGLNLLLNLSMGALHCIL